MAIISTEAIVLRSIDHRETSKLAFFFTRTHGKVIAVLKGIRKDPRKFHTSLDKLSVNDIVFYQYRNSDIHLVSHCDMKEHFMEIRRDIKRITAGEYACELVNKIMPLEEKNEAVYQLLLDYCRALGHSRDAGRLVHMFQIKLLTLSGFRPHIDSCVQCGGEIKARVRAKFNIRKGGLVCIRCEGRDLSLTPVSAGAVASLLYVEKHSWAQCLKLALEPSVKRELKHILNNFLIYHLEKNIKSARYLE
ncbi:MAG: DNA repair protein RecO [Candidatus Omnitrophica bacterium]|nr:DNA repair protein RecO [Candidatus Omnitrophota bacterium]